MVIRKILYLVGKYLGDKDLAQEAEGTTTTSEKYEIFAPYVNLLNIVQKRIATECFILKTKEVVETKSQEIFSFDKLSKNFYKIIKVCQSDKPVKFELIDNGVFLPEGKYEIWYQYVPTDVGFLDSEIGDFNGKVTERIYALGVAGEYCLLNGMYDTSNYFEQKFVGAINSIRVAGSFKSLPKRRWL